MRNQEEKEVLSTELITISCTCDECGKNESTNNIPNDWFEFSAHHNNWGNDSEESYKYYIVCSAECYSKKLKKVIDDFKKYYSAIINEMPLLFAIKLSNFLNNTK